MTNLHGGKVASVEAGSIAEEAGIEPGDYVVSINSHRLHDIIDARFYFAEEDVDILVKRGEEKTLISVTKDVDEPLGVDFEDVLFDGIRECHNRCTFCFVHQLPKGMRKSLYLRDDDFRLSFLHGNFITLSNVTDSDLNRIIEQRLSPLYVSVHATDPNLRQRMLGGSRIPDVMSQLRKLAAAGITVHTQIVVCPGVNDGDNLEHTVSDLAELHPAVQSVGIVPVGTTKHRKHLELITTLHKPAAREVLKQVRRWQREYMARFDTRLVWASDEYLLTAEVPTPSVRSYEGFPQLENGIGIVSQFVAEERKLKRRLPASIPHPLKATIVTGILASSIVHQFADTLSSISGLSVDVAPIVNEFFGDTVTVAGLITGEDIRKQLTERSVGDVVLIPSVMVREGVFLDDIKVDDLAAAIGTQIAVIPPTPNAIAEALSLNTGDTRRSS